MLLLDGGVALLDEVVPLLLMMLWSHQHVEDRQTRPDSKRERNAHCQDDPSELSSEEGHLHLR